MTAKTAAKAMRGAMGRLNKKERARLRWHAEKGTPIVCGRVGLEEWVDGEGGG